MTIEIPNFTPAIPEIFVLTMACVILMVDLLLTDRSRVVSYLLAQATLVGAALLTLTGMSTSSISTFSGMYVQDPMGDMLKLVMYLAVFIAFVYSRDYIQQRNMFRGEYFVLGLFGLLGMMVMVSASHFLTIRDSSRDVRVEVAFQLVLPCPGSF